MSEDEQGQSWHLDRRVPIVMLIAILGQAFAFGAMLANMDGRINANSTSFARLEQRQDRMDNSFDAMRATLQSAAVQTGRLEEQIIGLRTDIGRLLAAIEGGK